MSAVCLKKIFVGLLVSSCSADNIKPAKQRTDMCAICIAYQTKFGKKEYAEVCTEALKAAQESAKRFATMIKSWRSTPGQTPPESVVLEPLTEVNSEKEAILAHLKSKYECSLLLQAIVSF